MSADHMTPSYGPRDWSEDHRLENGDYSNHCADCKVTFIGHKRRIVCKVCADSIIPNVVQLLNDMEPTK